MKRYLLFAGMDYYPSGGWDDYLGDFITISECLSHLKEEKNRCWDPLEWHHIVDTKTMKIVEIEDDNG